MSNEGRHLKSPQTMRFLVSLAMTDKN